MSQINPELVIQKPSPSTAVQKIPQKYQGCHDSCSVTFDTEQEYNDTLNNPYPLAQKMRRDGIKYLFLFMAGEQRSRITLRVDSVIELGRRTGAIPDIATLN
jgi:hypothetical protein